MFFCSSVEIKTKACNEKRSGTIRETLSEKAARVLGRGKTTPAQKQNKTRSLTYCYKNERSAISKQTKSASQNTPFCPFSKGAQNHINHIALIICALQTTFCIFAFLCFCVLNFNCEMGRHRKGQSSGERLNKNSIRYFAHIYKRKEDASTLLTHPQYDWLNENCNEVRTLYPGYR